MSEADSNIPPNATELEKLLHRAKPWFNANGHLVIYGVAAILAVAAAVIFFNRDSGDSALAVQLFEASNSESPEALGLLADDHPATAVGAWSRLLQANALMQRAIPQLFVDREEAMEEIDEAEAAYQNLDRSDAPSDVRERALIGLARVAETRWDGEDESTDAAVGAWEELLKDYPDTLMKEHAESRIADLKSAEGRLFATQFVNFRLPSTNLPATPHGGGGPGVQMPNADFDSILRGLDSGKGSPDGEGDTTEGDTTEGDTTEGDTSEGDTTEGDTTEGDTRESGTTVPEIPKAEEAGAQK